MAGQFEKLTVALAVRRATGSYSVGTGVPVAEGIVLTARHVVVPEGAVDAPVRLRFWHATEPQFSPDPAQNPTGFLDAIGQAGQGAEAARGVIWSSEAFDAALVACAHPPSVPVAELSRVAPQDQAQWVSEAFPHAAWEKGAPEPVRIAGVSHSRVANTARYQVDTNIAMVRDPGASAHLPEGWSGASGAGLFVSGLLTGVLLARKPNGEAKMLEAVCVLDLLADPGFRAALGLEDARAGKHLGDLVAAIEPIDIMAKPKLAKALGLAEDASAETMAAALSALPLGSGIAHLQALGKGASPRDTMNVQRVAICYAACRTAPVDLNALRETAFSPDSGFEDCRAGSRMGAEFLMAAAEGRLPQFQPGKAGAMSLPPGTHALPTLPETGCGDATDALSYDLESRLGSDLLEVDKWLVDGMGVDCGYPVDNIDRINSRREVLQTVLAFRAKDPSLPSYYFAEDDKGPDRQAERDALQNRIRAIRKDYPSIGLVAINHDRAAEDFQRFLPLLPLLPKEVDP